MSTPTAEEFSGGTAEAQHLCVLVHGLWGNPNHLANVAKALREKHPPSKLYILVAKRNSGSFTYDGIELGGERVCVEIEEELEVIKSRGGEIKKLSIVGYSLGGLVARYAIGLLYAKGLLDEIECVNFTTFVTPHLGVRTPLRGWHNHLWNVLGARTLSMSGRQLFTIDKFRNTGKPLLSILAEPESVFMRGLRKFRRRTLYTNIVNDKSTVYYTTGISKTDPFANLGKIKPNYLKGYENVILDPRNPWSPLAKSLEPKTIGDFGTFAVQWLGRIPWILALVVFLPLGIVFFLVNSAVQSVRSWRRIRLHEEGRAGIPVDDYRGLPLLMDEVREAVEDAYEELNSSQTQEYLVQDGGSLDEDSGLDEQSHKILAIERKKSMPQEPTLALSPLQFKMIEALDRLTWRRYPVWIHKARHSHAAIIVRVEKPAFSEGWIVLKHWIKEEFIM